MEKPDGSKRIQTISGIVLLLVVVMLIGIYFLWLASRDIEMETTLVQIPKRILNSTVPATEEQLTIYSSEENGFEVSYTQDWDIATSSSGEGDSLISTVTLSADDEVVDIIVADQSMEGIIRNSISVDSETEVTVSGQSAQRLEGGDLKDGSPLTMIIIVSGGKIFSIKGSGTGPDSIVEHFILL